MNVLRRLGLFIVGLILFFSLLGAAWADVGARTIHNRDTVKTWLTESKFYDNITNAALEGLRSVEGEEAGTVPVDDPELQAQVRTIFTPDFLQGNIESVLDGTYNWLEGSVDKPDFVIDLREIKTRMASALGQYAAKRAATLPACTIPQPEFDALNANCVPAGMSTEQVASMVETEILNSDDFLKEEVLTADNFHAPGEGQTVTFFADPNTENIRRAYQFGSWAAPILFFLALLSTGAIILLSSTRRNGFIRAGFLILGAGAALGITYLVMSQLPRALKELANKNVDQSNATTQQLISDAVNVISADIRGVIGIYALIFAILGLILIIAPRFIGKKKDDDTPKPLDPTPPTDDSAHPINKPYPKVSEAAEKPKKVTKIQL